MITLKEIAQRCNVSIATVSNILNGKSNVSEATKKRVLQIVKETGYKPNYMARSLRSSKTNTIGVIIEDITVFSSPQQIDGITAAFEDKEYKLILENLRYYYKYLDADPAEYKTCVEEAIQEMLTIKVDGIIYVAGHSRKIDFLPINLPVPLVVSYSTCTNQNYPCVIIDDINSACKMTEFLIEKGHSNIAVVLGMKGNEHSEQRFEGYKMALKNHNLQLDNNLVYYGNWSRESGYDCCKNLMETSKDVSAIFCFNDLMAAGVYDYLLEKKLQPGKDLAVAGFDNREISTFLVPQLTTMNIPLCGIGNAAACILMDLIEEKTIPECDTKIMCKLIERTSV